MRVAITGAGGNLGRYAAPALRAAGHEVRLIDRLPLEDSEASVVADVRDRAAVRSALEGCDAVVHAAALHGIHLRDWTPEDYWAINATGTFNVFEAARELGIRKVVLCSTMGVYGASITPREGAWGFAHEGLELKPGDVYGLSKTLAEEMGRTYGRQWGVETVALRLGMFVPESSQARYGFRLLFGGVDDRDVAQAVVRALDYRPEAGFEAFNVMAETPFSEADLEALHADLPGILERAYPGSGELFQANGLDPQTMVWWPVLWSIDRAKKRLGYRPQYSFAEYLESLREGRPDASPVVGLPWWGVPNDRR